MIGIGIVGLGNIGKRHLSIIKSLPEFRLIAYTNLIEHADVNVPYYESIEELLNNLEIDVVSICTPNGLHAEQSIQCLNADKHVLVEKPMATARVDCESIIEASLHQSKYVFCMMQNRSSPISIELKNIISSQLLGEIYMIDLRCYWNRGEGYYSDPDKQWRGSKDMDGGTLFTQFAHYVDLVYWLFGDISIQNAQFANVNHSDMIDFEDTGIFQFKTKENALGSFQYTTSVWDKNFESTLTIIGEKGTIKVGGQYMNNLEYCHIENYEFPNISKVDNVENMTSVYKNVIDVLKYKENLTTNALDGLKVVEIIERVYAFKEKS